MKSKVGRMVGCSKLSHGSHVLPVYNWFSSGFSSFLSPFKNMPVGGLTMLNCP